jgi:acyl-CoA thioesterase FadM
MAEKYYVYEHVVIPQDVTVQGIAYDARFLDWACTARERMLVDNLTEDETEPPAFLTGEVGIRYMIPVFLYDKVEVRVGVTDYYQDTGRARLIFRFVKKGHIQSLAEGFQNIFCYDRLKGERIQLPESFILLAEKFKDPAP